MPYFERKLEDVELDLSVACKRLDKLVAVDVKLERSGDTPQLVLEAMNSRGKRLPRAGLIRNYVLMDLTPK